MPIIEADRIAVAAGVLKDRRERVLVGQRVVRDRYFGKWEFPGGKLEPGEAPERALARELSEELGVDATEFLPLIDIDHDYPDRKVSLRVLEVTRYRGHPHGREGQRLKWVAPQELDALDFLDANRPIMRAVQLPDTVYVTDTTRYGVEPTLRAVERLAAEGRQAMVQVRERNSALAAEPARLDEFVQGLSRLTRGSRVRLCLNGEPSQARRLGLAGAHLTAAALMEFDPGVEHLGLYIGASCHRPKELRRASELGLDYAFLGNVAPTASHPGRAPLGWSRFEEWVATARLPVYAIGGMSPRDRLRARRHAGQGVAMISAGWDELLSVA